MGEGSLKMQKYFRKPLMGENQSSKIEGFKSGVQGGSKESQAFREGKSQPRENQGSDTED